MGFHTQVEIPTSDGRMDVLIQTSDYIYIIECKLDGSAEEALQQIEVKTMQLLSLWISEQLSSLASTSPAKQEELRAGSRDKLAASPL